MKARFVPLALIVTLLLTVGAFTAACGDDGGDALTLEEYFQQLEALTATAEDRFVEFEAASDVERAAAVSEEDVLAALEDFYTNYQTLFTTTIDGLNDLNPPAIVEELHNEYVDASAEVAASLEEVLNEFGDQDFATDLNLFEDTGLIQAGERLVETCAALQDTADENEIDVDLDC